MTTVCHALWLEGPSDPALRRETLGEPGEAELRVAARFGAISRGTERLVATDRVPESEYPRMRAPLQDGDFPFPVKYGYAVVGTVEAGPAALTGTRVFVLHPHQDHFLAPVAMAVPIPADVPDERAVLAANMETALNAVWDAGIMPGDRVAVVGAGLVGLLTGHLAARIPGAEVTLIDVVEKRREAAHALGCGFASPENAPRDCDIVIHASASAAGLSSAIDAAGFEARIVELSWYGDRETTVSLGGAFHSRRLTLASSQVGEVPPARRVRWPHRRRLQTALSLLNDPRLDGLISGETRFLDLPGAYMAILDDPETLCHRVRYR